MNLCITAHLLQVSISLVVDLMAQRDDSFNHGLFILYGISCKLFDVQVEDYCRTF